MTQQATATVEIMCAFRCGKAVKDGHRLCDEHLEHQRVKMAEYRQNRKAKGLCSRCPNLARLLKNGQPSTLCDDCRTRVRTLEQAGGASKYTRKAKRVLRLRTSGLTLREISDKLKLDVPQVKQLIEEAKTQAARA